MQQKTHDDYISIAKHFIQTHADGELEITTILYALIRCTENHTKQYWSRLRRAISYYFEVQGRIEDAADIAAITCGTLDFKPKQKRVKKVSAAEHKQLISDCIEKQDISLAAALIIAKLTGCRPAEMLSITLHSGNRVHIIGAKKTEDGKRGLDRELILPADLFKHMPKLLKLLHQEVTKSDNVDPERAMHRIQRRLENAVRRLWPRRKHHITLYSYRHQLGSDLKSSGLDNIETSAILGHQNVNSANSYGDARSGRGSVGVRATQLSIASVRVTELKRPDFKAYLNQHFGRKAKTKTTAAAPARLGGAVPF